MPKNESTDLVPLFFKLPRDEAARLRAYAAAGGRPITWVVRDALRLYLDALEAHVAKAAAVELDAAAAGNTQPRRLGRPKKQTTAPTGPAPAAAGNGNVR